MMCFDLLCNAAKSWSPIFEASNTAIVTGGVVLNKVYNFSMQYFKAGSSCFFFGQATYQICQGAKEKKNNELEAKTSASATSILVTPPANYRKAHGALLAGAGVCAGLEALNAFDYITLGPLFSTVKIAGSLFLMYANFVALGENIRIYEDTSNLIKTADGEPSKELLWQRQSAVWGIASTLGCIFTLAFTLFGGATAVALLIGIVSACTGALKALYDFLLWSKQIIN